MDEFDFTLEDCNPKNWQIKEDLFWNSREQNKEIASFLQNESNIYNDFLSDIKYNPIDFESLDVKPASDFGIVPSIDEIDVDDALKVNLDTEWQRMVEEVSSGAISLELNDENYHSLLPLDFPILNEFDAISNEINRSVFNDDPEDEKKFELDAMRTIDPNEALNFECPLVVNRNPKSWLEDHNYTSDQNMNAAVEPLCNEPIYVDTKKNTELETNIDVWGPSHEDSSATPRNARNKPHAECKNFTDYLRGGVKSRRDEDINKLSRKKRSFSRIANSTQNMMKDLRVALKTCSGSRRSTRNIRPRGSVETTPSGSDFEDGYHGYTQFPPAKRMRVASRSVNQTSNKLIPSELNFKGESLRLKKSSSRTRHSAHCLDKVPALHLDSIGGHDWRVKENLTKQNWGTGLSISRTTNRTKKRSIGNSVPKLGKQKTLKEKEGHRENEKLRRDKLKNAFLQLKSDIPFSYLVDDVRKPPSVISKQKILNGAVKKLAEVYKRKKERVRKFGGYCKFFKNADRRIYKSRTFV